MSKKITTEDFIKKAKELHGDKYDYSETFYKKAAEKVTIICKTHGEFLQSPNAHTSGYGCARCGSMREIWSKEKFIAELNKRCGFYNYRVVGEYKGTQNTILVENRYGICDVRANHLLCGVIPGIETAIDKDTYWINQAIEKHGYKYDYSLVKYDGSDNTVKIICKIHGIFEQISSTHLSGRGCVKCKKEENRFEKMTLYSKTFFKKVKELHNNKYTYYENLIFKAKEKIPIICPLHGEFLQIAANHLQGANCWACMLTIVSERMRLNPTGWSYNNWENAAKNSKNFDSFKVYIIRCWNEEEEFYKIGKTFLTIEKRFRSKSILPYQYELIEVLISEDSYKTCESERMLKNCNKENKYVPLKKFNGMYECFKELDMSCFEDYNLDNFKND